MLQSLEALSLPEGLGLLQKTGLLGHELADAVMCSLGHVLVRLGRRNVAGLVGLERHLKRERDFLPAPTDDVSVCLNLLLRALHDADHLARVVDDESPHCYAWVLLSVILINAASLL